MGRINENHKGIPLCRGQKNGHYNGKKKELNDEHTRTKEKVGGRLKREIQDEQRVQKGELKRQNMGKNMGRDNHAVVYTQEE